MPGLPKQDTEYLHLPRKFPQETAWGQCLTILLRQSLVCFLPLGTRLAFLEFHVNGIIQLCTLLCVASFSSGFYKARCSELETVYAGTVLVGQLTTSRRSAAPWWVFREWDFVPGSSWFMYEVMVPLSTHSPVGMTDCQVLSLRSSLSSKMQTTLLSLKAVSIIKDCCL